MRLYMPLVTLLCSVQLAFSVVQEEGFSLDTYNYVQLWSASQLVLEQFKDRIEPVDESGELVRLEPNDEGELQALTAATTYALLAFVRMHQEVACLLEQEDAARILQERWDDVKIIYSVVPERTVDVSMKLVKQLLELTIEAEGKWKPADNCEKYIPASEWKAVRLEVAAYYCHGFAVALTSAD